ncbi:MAG: sigma-70 family RNA polymerase sigma factor [Longimicrobiales bacterium]|nr:sigma-70 family RNA polymerase sigma factor [Longimicrobiales bacterium]
MKTRGRLVFSVAWGYSRDFDRAEDLFHEIWLKVIEKRRFYSGHGSFDAWLHRLATNVCISEHRARRARREAHDRMAQEGSTAGHSWPDPLSNLEHETQITDLHGALAQLSGREHQAIFLRILEGKTPGEVARVMGVKKSTVRSIIRHGTNRLRELMKDQEHGLS